MKISRYGIDTLVSGNDRWIGSDADNNNATMNFTPDNLSLYYITNGYADPVRTGLLFMYQVQNTDAKGVFNLPSHTATSTLANIPLDATLTDIRVSKLDNNRVNQSVFINYIVGSPIKIITPTATQEGNYALYTLNSVTDEGSYFNLRLTFLAGQPNARITPNSVVSISLLGIGGGSTGGTSVFVDNNAEGGIDFTTNGTDVSGIANVTQLRTDVNGKLTQPSGNPTVDSIVQVSTTGVESYVPTPSGGGTSHAVFTPSVVGSAEQAIGNFDNSWNLTLRNEAGFTYVWDIQDNDDLGLPTGWTAAKSSTQQTLTITTPPSTTTVVNQTITPTATSTHTADGTTAVHRLSINLRTFETYFTGQFTSNQTSSVQNSLLTANGARLTSGTTITFEPDTDGTTEYAVVNIHSSFGTPAFHASGFLITPDSYPLSGGFTTYVIPFRRTLRLEITN